MTKEEFVELVKERAFLSADESERVAVAVLHTLRSQLSQVEVSDVYETLPEDIDTLWEGSWLMRLTSRLIGLRELDRDEFLEQVREAVDVRTIAEAERLAKAVFAALKAAIPVREVQHIVRDLPEDLRDLWAAA